MVSGRVSRRHQPPFYKNIFRRKIYIYNVITTTVLIKLRPWKMAAARTGLLTYDDFSKQNLLEFWNKANKSQEVFKRDLSIKGFKIE